MTTARFILLLIVTAILSVMNIYLGSVDIPAEIVTDVLTGSRPESDAERYIILESRIPQMLTAIIAGAALASSGLLLQTAFRNPLAGPSVLGINSGASLGVAVVVLLFGGSVSAGAMSWSGYAAVMAGAFVGSLAVIGVLLALSAIIRSDLMLLIVGVMIGYLASSLIMLLNYTSTADGIRGYVVRPHSALAAPCQAAECDSAWRRLCGKPRRKSLESAQYAPAGHWAAVVVCDGLLRSDSLYRSGHASCGTNDIPHVGSPHSVACNAVGRVGCGVAL